MIEHFRVEISESVLNDLKLRLRATRLPPKGEKSGWEDGTNPDYLENLLEYWRDVYDWRSEEAKLNQWQHFRTVIDGTLMHFVHQRGVGPDPMPLVLTHGYPDTFHRFHKLIPLLTDPASHGGDPRDAFDLVVPSLPGYGFSQARVRAGGAFGFGALLHKLMGALGYDRYGAHGGDWGSTVTEQLARNHADAVIGIHLTNVPFSHTYRKPECLSAAEEHFLERIKKFQTESGAYAMIQGTRPATLAPSLNDSPIGLAAWIIEKFKEWSDCDGDVETRFTKDELLTNVMIYWVTQTIESSFQPYRDFMKASAARWTTEAAKDWIDARKTPMGFASFPRDIAPPPREWAQRFYDVQRWTEMPRGGHFAALEEPDLLAADIRAFFRPLRKPT